MRKAIPVDKDSNTNKAIACDSRVPVPCCKRDVVGLDTLAVAGLVVADEEGNVL